MIGIELVILTSGLFVVLILTYRGYTRPDALSGSPPRQAGLGPQDLGIALVVILGPQMLRLLNSAPAETAGTRPAQDPYTFTAGALLSQALFQLPLGLYLIVRVGLARDGWREIGLLPRRPGRDVLRGILGLLAAVPMVFATILGLNILSAWLKRPVTPHLHPMLEAAGKLPPPGAMAMLLFSTIVVAPILEEIIYRGLVQTSMLEVLGRKRRWMVVLLAALLFSAGHFGVADWTQMTGLFLLGVVLGWLYERSGSLLPSVLLHAGFNALNLAVLIMMTR